MNPEHNQLRLILYLDDARPHSRCKLRSYLVKHAAGANKRAQKEIQEQSSNTEEQATSNAELNTSIA